MKTRRPLVVVVGQAGTDEAISSDRLEEPYAVALVELAGAHPMLLSRHEPLEALTELVDRVDGILLTGDVSNVEPWRYGSTMQLAPGPFDPRRDALALALVAEARRRPLPLLGICRGHEEINVAYGGTLWTAVHEQPGMLDHREPDDPDPARRYRLAHEVRAEEGGWLRASLARSSWMVNSLHGQGIRTLGAELTVEARAPDGLIEAVSDMEGGRWILGIQWHPEWQAAEDPVSREIFLAFGAAVSRQGSGRIGSRP